MTNLTNLIWNNLLEPAIGGDAEDRLKQLTCGCLVACDGDYLDMFVWTSTRGTCNQGHAHNVVLAYQPFAYGEDSPEKRSALLAAIEEYTENWQYEREPLLALFTTALKEN